MRLIVLLALLIAGTAHAENVLEDIAYTALPGGKVEVTLKFAAPVQAPQIFTTESPPRIAIDLADTRNGMAQKRIEVGAGATAGISAIEAAGRTRVVIDLFRPASYEKNESGNTLVLTVNSGVNGSTVAAVSAAATDPTKAIPVQGLSVSNVDFRRGKNGEGRVIVAFSGPGAAANLKREGTKVVVDVANATLPPNLAQRLDVLDFATPVQSIETRARGSSGVRVEIAAQPPYEQLAYQTGNEYVVEITPKRDDQKLKGKNAEPEYTGSRVTFNFQDIPTRSVLQLIADVSDLNIVVADSVQGNVTLRLINVPWDQALDIVLQAKGLDKRRRGNVIWVAPQKEIAEREEAIADARMKIEDKEALVSDYIPISYGKAKDVAALLTKEAAANTGGGSSGGGSQQRGFLSSRGSVTFDDRTNILLVSDIPSKIQEVRQLVSILDRPVQQVLIESRIVIASDSFARELGVKFGVSGGYETSNGNVITTSGTAFGTDEMNNVILNNRFGTNPATPGGRGSRGLGGASPGNIPSQPQPGAQGGIAVPSLGDRLNVNMPVSNPAGSFGLAILGADYLLDLELSAAQTEGRGEVISTPRVITASQKEADIKQGQEVGYVTFQSGGTGAPQATVNFKEAVLE
ncbi:MAG TPA: type IV pilus secretin PilQ, partial [Rhodanobacteraceae bacterium]|nr:type IV pilus secretin PilQ [Rhodanobacteraceae bacterium]